jgi:hypothetical protein
MVVNGQLLVLIEFFSEMGKNTIGSLEVVYKAIERVYKA